MLPPPSSPEFPSALKAAREAANLSRATFARMAQVHSVMPRRYEEPDAHDFAKPTHNTWLALNKALGFVPPAIPGTPADTLPVHAQQSVSLAGANTDEIVAELRKRGISATLTFPT